MDTHTDRLAGWARRLRSLGGETFVPEEAPPPEAWGVERADAVDRRLWELVAGEVPPAAASLRRVSGLRLSADGPLLESTAADAVEVWVDRELSAMHALHRFARTVEGADWSARIRSAIEWHLEHTGAENATHRPWALHLFILHGSADAEFFAAGQLHAVAVEHAGRAVDPCSAWILGDAARELEREAGGGPNQLA